MCKDTPLSTGYNAVYGLEDVVLVLLHMCKNETTANRAVTELFLTFRDDRNVSIPTVQWLLGDDRCDRLQQDGYPVQAHVKSTIRKRSCLEKKTGHMPVIDKHLIPFTGADRYR